MLALIISPNWLTGNSQSNQSALFLLDQMILIKPQSAVLHKDQAPLLPDK